MNAVTKSNGQQISEADIATLEQAGIIPQGTPAPQIRVFAHVARERGLSPFSKEVYLVKYGSIYSTIVGINGLRKIAAESGELAGCDDIKFDLQPDGAFLTAQQLKKANRLPVTATCTVYRIVKGLRCPFTHTAVFAEFAGTGPKWQQMPFQMIGKVAEAFALRKAFSERVAGLDIEEEAGAYEQTAVREVSELDRAKNRCRERLEQCRMDDRREDNYNLRIESATDLAVLREIYKSMEDYLPPTNNPAQQNREFIKTHGQ